MKAILALEDGTVIDGEGFGTPKTVFGELVFNTSMTGYQKALTDPSYKGQLLMFTYPLIGNYGVSGWYESDGIKPEGAVVAEWCSHPANSAKTIGEFLREHRTPGIAEVDTRALTRHIRRRGTVKAALAFDGDPEDIVEMVREMPHPMERNLVAEVGCDTVSRGGRGKRVVLIDCGTKRSILGELEKRFEVVRVPYRTSKEEIEALEPDGICISNGPGDPAHPALSPLVKALGTFDYPMLGICLGHQLLALSLGASTYKLKFGHRGANQPVKDLRTGKVYITAQNHGYAVAPTDRIEVTHVNVNDGTVEGFQRDNVMGVQYHPEGSPGPNDSMHVFDDFAGMI